MKALREHLGVAVTTEELELLMSAMDDEDTGRLVYHLTLTCAR